MSFDSVRPDLRSTTARNGASASRALIPEGVNRAGAIALLVGFLAMYLPSYLELARQVWPTDEQGHGPIILAVSLWLLVNKRHELASMRGAGSPAVGGMLLGIGLLAYAFGRSQSFLLLEVGSQIVVLIAMLLLFAGVAGLRVVWFPLLFLVFMVPLPDSLVSAVTAPLKSAVSAIAADLLYRAGYPVGRAGVILSVGPYQLLVADACAGLNSMFTLEALGLLYANLMRYTSVARNVALAVLVVPIAFFANIVRVLILVLVTYYFGDAAGQGFVHGFAGMVLFMVGLVLLLLTDKVLGAFFPGQREAA